MGPLFLFFVYFFPVILIFISKHLEMDKYEIAEKQGREKVFSLISGHCLNYEFTKDRYCNVDLFITGKTGTIAVMEIKNRTGYTSNEVDELGGHIIEWTKYTGLTSYEGYLPLYTIIYPDALLMWDVSKINEESFFIENDKYPKSTVGNRERIKKKVAYLKKSDCCTVIKIYNEEDG